MEKRISQWTLQSQNVCSISKQNAGLIKIWYKNKQMKMKHFVGERTHDAASLLHGRVNIVLVMLRMSFAKRLANKFRFCRFYYMQCENIINMIKYEEQTRLQAGMTRV